MKSRNPFHSMMHTNGNLICAVDVETTGSDPEVHEICQLAILPADADLREITSYPALNLLLKPERPEAADPKALKVSGLTLEKLAKEGLDHVYAQDLFWEWVEGLQLGLGKRMLPLASNWVFDRSMIIKWLGLSGFETAFHPHYRDTQAVALFQNDRFEFFNNEIPFPRVGLPPLGEHFKVDNLQAHDALQDCRQTIGVYRELVRMFSPSVPKVESNGS